MISTLSPRRPIWTAAAVPRRRYSVAEYHTLQQRGEIGTADRVELLEGWLVEKMTHNPRHALAIEQIQEVLSSLVPAGWRLRVQLPITTIDSEPEPDLAIVRAARRGRRLKHPTPDEVAVLIEVADSTLVEDRGTKSRIYARAGIQSYWIVNLVDRCVEVYSEPTGATLVEAEYLGRIDYAAKQSVPLLIEGQAVTRLRVRDLLP